MRPRVVPRVVPRVPRPRTAVGLFFAAGSALVADVPPWSVLRLKLAQMLVLDVPSFMKLGSFLSCPAIGSVVRVRVGLRDE